MTLLIKIPVQVNNDIDGFDTLAKIAADTMILVGQNIHLDFEDCIFFSGNLCAVLGGIIHGVLQRRNKVEIINLPPSPRCVSPRNVR